MYLITDNKYKINIWWSAKCACTYIKNMYYVVILGYDIEDVHINESYTAKYVKNNYKNVYVCRNPYARIVSSYVHRLELYDKYESFEDFINLIYQQYVKCNTIIDEKDFIHHTTPQFSELYPLDESFKLDSITKMEDLYKTNLLKEWFNITTDIKLKDNFGYNTNVQRNNYIVKNAFKLAKKDIIEMKKENNVPYYTSFYNEEIKNKVNEIYNVDFKILEYYNIIYKLE